MPGTTQVSPLLPAAYQPTAKECVVFARPLHDWYQAEARDLPWRRTRDAYRIWISEVMLQQTRVDQAWSYYERFIHAFPTISELAAASIDDVLRVWEGLGYYARARNLHRATREVVDRYGGEIPGDFATFRSLSGVGPYTAAAVLSIAFDQPFAVLDGNVARILTRVFRIDEDVKAPRTRRMLQELADVLLAGNDPNTHNQALMELGATVCTPKAPRCSVCPLQEVCRARQADAQERYPVTTPRPAVPHYDIAVGVLFDEAGRVLIQRRPDEGLLGGLWEFPGGKREPGESMEETCRRELKEELQVDVEIGSLICKVKHAYTHFKITLYAFRCRSTGTPRQTTVPMRWVELSELAGFAFPRANRRLIESLLEQDEAPSLFQ